MAKNVDWNSKDIVTGIVTTVSLSDLERIITSLRVDKQVELIIGVLCADRTVNVYNHVKKWIDEE